MANTKFKLLILCIYSKSGDIVSNFQWNIFLTFNICIILTSKVPFVKHVCAKPPPCCFLCFTEYIVTQAFFRILRRKWIITLNSLIKSGMRLNANFGWNSRLQNLVQIIRRETKGFQQCINFVLKKSLILHTYSTKNSSNLVTTSMVYFNSILR